MTLLVCHREDGIVTLLADTRISGAVGALTDIGPKILTVPIIVSQGVEAPLPPVRATYGFGFAGSTLVAMSTYGLVASCLQSLVSPHPPRLPAASEVAQLFARVGTRYMREIQATFEGFVVGPPEGDLEPQAFSLMPSSVSGQIALESQRLDPARRGLWALGSGARPYMAWAQERRGRWQTIIETVDAFIQANIDPKVGGHLQCGRCDADGFSQFMTLSVDTESETVRSAFLGVDEDELGLVDGLDMGTNAIGPRRAFRSGAFSARLLREPEATYVGYWRSGDELLDPE
jgi:hypothetical protein